MVEINNVRHISLIGWDRLCLATTPSYGHPSFNEGGDHAGCFFQHIALGTNCIKFPFLFAFRSLIRRSAT